MPEELLGPVIAFIQAKQDHNAKALLKMLHEDIIFIDQNKVYKGREEIKIWAKNLSQQEKYSYEIINVITSGSETRVKLIARDALDKNPKFFTFIFIIRQGLISEITLT
jgi:hypothetical protein